MLNNYLIIVNVISFIIYFVDKEKSKKKKYRIPEKVLLSLSIIGGCFGSLLSMCIFHHKTKHIKFILLNPLFCIVWIMVYCYFLTK